MSRRQEYLRLLQSYVAKLNHIDFVFGRLGPLWRHMVVQHLVNTSSGNGMLPDDTRPFSEKYGMNEFLWQTPVRRGTGNTQAINHRILYKYELQPQITGFNEFKHRWCTCMDVIQIIPWSYSGIWGDEPILITVFFGSWVIFFPTPGLSCHLNMLVLRLIALE